MKKIHNFILYCSKTWWAFLIIIVLFSFSLFLLIQISAQFANVTNQFQPFDMQSTLTETEIESQLAFYTSESYKIYFRFFIADFFFPLLGGFFITALSAFALRFLLSPNLFQQLEANFIFLFFLSPTLFDWLENISTIILLQSYPPADTTLISTILFFKSAKFFTLYSFQGLAVLFLLLAMIKFVFTYFTQKEKS